MCTLKEGDSRCPSNQNIRTNELLAGYEKSEDLLGEDRDPAGRGSGNDRSDSHPKTVLTEDGAVDRDVPRDRKVTFDPQIVPKGEARLDGFNDKIIGSVQSFSHIWLG